MINSYTSLRAAVADWLLRPDMIGVIPSLISLAEANFNRRLRLRAMVKQTILVSANGRAALPEDFLEARKVQIDGNPPRLLRYVTPYELVELRNDPVQYYTTLGKTLLTRPDTFTETVMPNEILQEEDGGFLLQEEDPEEKAREEGQFNIGLTYYGAIPALSGSNETNLLLSLAPDIYLYGTLAAAAPYLHEDERLGVWKTLFDQACEEQRIADERADHGSAPLSIRPRRSY